MGQRILTDASGGRWDVSDAENGLRFRHPPDGPSYEVKSDKGVDQLKDPELIRMLDQERERQGEDPVGHATGDEGAPGGGY